MAAPTEYLFSTALKWRKNGELSTIRESAGTIWLASFRELAAVNALVMAADQRPFQINPTRPMTYVALIADATGRTAHVYGNTNSWEQFVDELEDIGCEVVENQTEEYESLAEIQRHCIPSHELVNCSDFVGHV